MSKFSSIFSQLLSLFSKNDFYCAIKETNAERHARGFSSWDQFVAMLFCQVGRAHSLKLGATTIAAVYKDRWQIETFFKALKQNLKIKTFVGTGGRTT